MSTMPQQVAMFCGVCAAVLQGGECPKGHPQPPPQAYDPSTWKRGARFEHEGLDPSTGAYLTVEDRLRVVIYSSLAAQVDVAVRIQRPDGQIIPILKSFNVLGVTRAANTFEFDLCEGFLLSLNVNTPSTIARRGTVYADIAIIRGAGANAISMRSLADAYIIVGEGFGWPDDIDYSSVDGYGIISSVGVGNPAAGADWTVSVPAGARWQVLAINAVLTTSAAVAARAPSFVFKDGGGATMYTAAVSGTQAASLTQTYSAGPGVPVFSAAPIIMTALPVPSYLMQAFSISSSTAALQAGDQWSAIKVTVQEWLEL